MPSRPSIARVVDVPKLENKTVVQFPVPARVKNPAAVALGKLGGSKGGKIRAANLTPEERITIAQKAANARWAKVKAK